MLASGDNREAVMRALMREEYVVDKHVRSVSILKKKVCSVAAPQGTIHRRFVRFHNC